MTKNTSSKNRRKRSGESRHSPRRIESVENQLKALEYRKLGYSYAQIAKAAGMASAQTAWNAVESALKRTLQEPADAVRKLELERLDTMFIPAFANASKGDLMAIATVLNIMARRARLIGLDAPEKKELTGKDGAELNTVATVIIVGGPGEEGEPLVMGESIADNKTVATVPTVLA